MGNYIDRIIQGDLQAFDDLYIQYKKPVITIVRNIDSRYPDILPDCFHSACLTLLEKCESGQLKEGSLPDKSVKSYMVTTTLNILRNSLRKGGKDNRVFLPMDDPEQSAYIQGVIERSTAVEDDSFEEKIAIIRQAVKEMPAPCDYLLKIRHFDKYSSDDIAARMGYANGDVAKNMVGRCMKKLKVFVRGKFEQLGL